MIKNVLMNIIVFIVVFVVCIGLLVAVCHIPQNKIYNKSLESSEYFSDQAGFPVLIDGHANTRMDNYADCVLFNVIYNVDEEHVLKSIISAPYYHIEGNGADADMAASVVGGKEPNDEYSRYWHGSQVLIRPLLIFASVEQIRVVLFALLVVLNTVLAAMLVCRKDYVPAGIYFVSLILVQFWMSAFTIEYVMSFLVMTAVCIAVTMLCRRDTTVEDQEHTRRNMTYIFIISGAVTCFLDFLTTETLTFTVPFIMYILLSRNNGGIRDKVHKGFKSQLLDFIKWGVAWISSYAAMFIIKWALIYGVMGKSAFLNVLESAAYRIEGDVAMDNAAAVMGEVVSSSQSVFIGILKNIACLLPASDRLTVSAIIWITLGILMLLAVVLYLFRGERVDGPLIGIMLLVALIPYLRYMCLSNHAFIHYFFTYRAQMAVIMSLSAIMIYNLKPSYVIPAIKRRKK